MTADVPAAHGTWWTFYSDASGNGAVLNIEVERRRVVLTTAAGEVLSLTPTDVAMLLENLELALDHCVKPPTSRE
jgi:hypothetical protein